MSISCVNLKKTFLEYFQKHEHTLLSSASLIPKGDNSLLFVNSGMVPFKNYFLGTEHSKYPCVATSQKSLRAGGKHNDIEQIGHTKRHHTFFEMLGNFSFGDYFKDKAIQYAWDFITNVLQIDKTRLYVTVHVEDEESVKLWSQFIAPDRIYRMKGNFWSMGDTGPCGPCSEIFYDLGDHLEGSIVEDYGDRYLEIWNLVFMSFEQTIIDGQSHMRELQTKCVDTGAGLERLAIVMNGIDDTFLLDEFASLIAHIAKRVNIDMHIAQNTPACKILADHTRAIAFLLSENILPGNDGREYVVRKLIRRCARFIYSLTNSINEFGLLSELIELFGEQTDYPEIKANMQYIQRVLYEENERFKHVLTTGMEKINILIGAGQITGADAFNLYQTYGFPLEITKDIAKEHNLTVNEEEYHDAQTKHRELAQQSWKGSHGIEYELENIMTTEFIGYTQNNCSAMIIGFVKDGKYVENISTGDIADVILDRTTFYGEGGGQIGDTGKLVYEEIENIVQNTTIVDGIYMHRIIAQIDMLAGEMIDCVIDVDRRKKLRAYHTATHLLNHALRKVLGDHVTQKGSLVSADKLRFDFTHTKAMTNDELSQIEEIVNGLIYEGLSVNTSISDYEAALMEGCITCPGEAYPETVRVVKVARNGDVVSTELCCGTHVSNTFTIGLFKIIKEASIGSYTRRIEALCGLDAINYINQNLKRFIVVCESLKTTPDQVIEKLKKMTENKSKTVNKNITEDMIEVQRYGVDGCVIFVDSNETEIMQHLSKKYAAYKFLTICMNDVSYSRIKFMIRATADVKDILNISVLAQELRDIGAKCGGDSMQIHGSIVCDKETILAKLRYFCN